MTTKSIKLEDPKHTTIIANIIVKDASHLSITRDPRIRELVLNSVKTLRHRISCQEPSATAGYRHTCQIVDLQVQNVNVSCRSSRRFEVESL